MRPGTQAVPNAAGAPDREGLNRDGTAFVVFPMTPPGDRLYARNKIVVDRAAGTLRFR
jgi:hypothetical protein